MAVCHSTQTARPRRGDAIIRKALAVLDSRLHKPGALLDAPSACRDLLKLHMADLEHEVFAVLFLDARNRLIEYRELFRGTLTQTSIYPREVVKESLILNAAAVILAHNHPSGCAEPSRADEMLTQSLKQALALAI
jgi:DNA repair protein RadC